MEKENSYLKLKEINEKKYNALPIKWAYTREQLEEMFKAWGLDLTSKDDCQKVLRILRPAGYCLKADYDYINQVVKEVRDSEKNAIAADKTGDGYIYEMFYYELNNYEYGITYDYEDTLYGLGLTLEEVEKSPALLHGLTKAARQIEREQAERDSNQ